MSAWWQKQRQKEADAAAAAASSSSSSTLGKAKSYRYHALQHFLADPEKTLVRNREQQLDGIIAKSFGELRYCRLPTPRTSTLHSCLVEASPLMDPSAYAMCTVCPLGGVKNGSVINLTLHSNPQNLADLQAVRVRWLEAHKALLQELADNNDKRYKKTAAQMAGIVTNVGIVSDERDAWIQYTLIAYDVVRDHLIKTYALIHSRPVDAAAIIKANPSLAAYTSYMHTYIVEFNTRTSAASSGSGSEHGVPMMWCFVHDKPGHQFPVNKWAGYNPACWVCKTDTPPPMPKDAMDDVTTGFADANTFKAICGKAQLAGQPAAAAASSMRAAM